MIGGFVKVKEGIEEMFEFKMLNVEFLMIFVVIGFVLIGYWVEGVILIFIFFLSGVLEIYMMNKSSRDLIFLM